jgi:glycosyltransferase involved in cell wall biosynthesis
LYDTGVVRPQISFRNLYSSLMKLHRRRELRAIARESLLLANSPELVSEVRNEYGKDASFVPTNTLSTEECPSYQSHVQSSPMRILFCGRVVREKGILELVQSVGLLHERGVPCLLDVVGPFKNEARVEIEATALASNVAERVVLHGPIPYGPELFSFYQRAEVFALPTYSEGFPHAIWEAAAHSCPVVTCCVGGIPALWKNEVHGLTVKPQDPELIATAILRFRNDSVLRLRLTENAYRHALNFTVEVCALELATVLSNLWERQP